MISRVIRMIEETPLTSAGLLSCILGITLLRALLEVFSSPTMMGFVPLDPLTLLHYGTYYLATYFLFALITGWAMGNYAKAARFVLFGLPIVLVVPVLDLLLTAGAGDTVEYLFDSLSTLLDDFFLYLVPFTSSGINTGMRIEAFCMVVAVGTYVYLSTKSIVRAVLGSAVVYVTVFLTIISPTVIYLLFSIGDVSPFFNTQQFIITLSQDASVIGNALPSAFVPASERILVEMGFNKIMSLMCVLLALIAGGALLWQMHRPLVLAHLRNSRPLRLSHFIILVLGGSYLAAHGSFAAYSTLHLISLFVLLLGFVAAWMVAVCVNDIHDQDIDAVSNAERPLVTGSLGESSMRESVPLLFAFSVLAAGAAGYYPLIFLLMFTAAYYLYSAPPVRFKRFPVLSSFLISLAFASAFLAGFFLTAADKSVFLVPSGIVFAIVICYTLAVNARDLKDIAGDTEAGIATVPTILAKRFGERAAFRGVGLLVALSFLVSPFLLPIPGLLIPAIIAAVAGYLACTVEPYKEFRVLIVHFAYLAYVGLMLFF